MLPNDSTKPESTALLGAFAGFLHQPVGVPLDIDLSKRAAVFG